MTIITTKPNIEISFSKGKIALLILGGIVFVIIGYFFITDPSKFARSNSTITISIVGYAAVIFFWGSHNHGCLTYLIINRAF